MKKTIAVVSSLVVMFSASAVHAETSQSVQSVDGNASLHSQKIAIDGTLSITKYDDGRVAPVASAAFLSDDQLDKTLQEMKFTDTQVKKMSKELKRQLVHNGGVQVELSNLTQHSYYTSLDGTEYEITDFNKAQVEEIKAKDLKLLNKPTLLSYRKSPSAFVKGGVAKASPMSIPVGSVSDGIFTSNSIMLYMGKTSNAMEFLYDLYGQYDWSDVPNFYFTDTIAQSWDTGISSETSNGANNILGNYSGTYTQEAMSINRAIGGTKGDIDLAYSYHQYGAIHDLLHVPVASKGLYKQVLAKYYHAYYPSIANVIMGYLGINLQGSFTGQSWDWSGGFTVGNQ